MNVVALDLEHDTRPAAATNIAPQTHGAAALEAA